MADSACTADCRQRLYSRQRLCGRQRQEQPLFTAVSKAGSLCHRTHLLHMCIAQCADSLSFACYLSGNLFFSLGVRTCAIRLAALFRVCLRALALCVLPTVLPIALKGQSFGYVSYDVMPALPQLPQSSAEVLRCSGAVPARAIAAVLHLGLPFFAAGPLPAPTAQPLHLCLCNDR